jgi:hypothetical protein
MGISTGRVGHRWWRAPLSMGGSLYRTMSMAASRQPKWDLPAEMEVASRIRCGLTLIGRTCSIGPSVTVTRARAASAEWEP